MGVILTQSQMDALYTAKLVGERNTASMAEMRRVLDSCNVAVPIIKEQVRDLKTVINLKDVQIATRDKTISDAQGIIVHREKQIIRQKWKTGFVGTLGVIATGFMTYAYFTKR